MLLLGGQEAAARSGSLLLRGQKLMDLQEVGGWAFELLQGCCVSAVRGSKQVSNELLQGCCEGSISGWLLL
ncbi:unnamed protein product [Amaranthus hypochondriacus]